MKSSPRHALSPEGSSPTQPTTTNTQGPTIVVEIKKKLAPLIPGFLENRQRDVMVLLGAVSQGDYEAIQGVGHSLKGVGGAFGFDPITDLGATIESSARAGNSEGIKVATARLADYLDRVEVVFT